jgi:hypothetical protein
MKRINTIASYYLLFVFLMTVSLAVTAQDEVSHKDKWEQIRAQKIAYLTNKMELTPEQAARFWPVYNEYAEKRDKLISEIFPKLSDEELERLMKLSDKEAAESMDNYFAKQTRLLQVEKEYNARFRKILPAQKVLNLYLSEMMFRKELFSDLKKSKRDKQNP